jgi:hypothetical protein
MMIYTNAHYKTALDCAAKDFDAEDPVRGAFVNVVNYLLTNDVKNINYLTFGMLREAAKLTTTDGEILHRTIAYLTGCRANLLRMCYEYVADAYEHELTAEEVNSFLQNDEFFDPRTGLTVPDSADSIYVFFRPNYSAFH